MSDRTPGTGQAPSTEALLLAAAVDVFAERGYDKAGVAEIARRAGLTTGAIYSRYRGKAELLAAALDAALADHLEALFAAEAMDSPTGMLSLLGRQLLEEDDRVAGPLFLEAVVAARHEPELGELLVRTLARERSRISTLIEDAKQRGLFDEDLDTEAVLTFIQSIGLGFMLLRAVGAPGPDPEAWQVVIDRVIAAAMPEPHSPAPTVVDLSAGRAMDRP